MIFAKYFLDPYLPIITRKTYFSKGTIFLKIISQGRVFVNEPPLFL